MTYNFIRYMEMAFIMIQRADPNAKMPQFNVQSKSNFISTGKINNGSIKGELVVPKQHILEMAS